MTDTASPTHEREYPKRTREYPFPLYHDTYRYTTNLQPGAMAEQTAVGSWGETLLWIDDEEHYAHEVGERAALLDRDPSRSATLPHMLPAEWDALVYLMRQLADEFPDVFSFELDGQRGRWINRRLDIEQEFRVGDASTLPHGPLEYISRQMTEDVALLDQREGHLFVDAGVVTFSAGWSFPFNVGMSFQLMHGPTPRATPDGVFARAESMMMRLQPGEAYRRLNWVMQGGWDLDVSLDSMPDWLPERMAFLDNTAPEDFADNVNMRVELQHIIRLPVSGAILFLIQTRFLTLRELAEVPEWRTKMLSVIAELPEDMAHYKGFDDIRPHIVTWLEARVAAGDPVGDEKPTPRKRE